MCFEILLVLILFQFLETAFICLRNLKLRNFKKFKKLIILLKLVLF